MSSFKRKGSSKQTQLFAGTRFSSSSPTTIITSTGIPSLDDIFGGGLPLSCTSVIFNPDSHSAYGDLVQKYVVAQGLAWDHHVCVVAPDGLKFVKECMWMPNPLNSLAAGVNADTTSGGDDNTDSVNDTDGDIKIAWRYKQMKQFTTTVPTSSTATEQFCRTLDLSCKLPENVVEKALLNKRLSVIDVFPEEPNEHSTTRVIAQLSSLLAETLSVTEPVNAIRPLRIVIPSFGSPFWGDLTAENLLLFLQSLRALLRRYSFACASICFSPHASTDAWGGVGWTQKVGWFTDSALTMSAFTGDPALSATFPSYHGLLHTHTLPAPHTVLPPSDRFSILRGLSPSAVSACGGSGENNLAFKCTRKRLVFETLHLDVEGGVGERRTTPSAHSIALDTGLSGHGLGPDPPAKDATIPRSIATVQVELETPATTSSASILHQEAQPLPMKDPGQPKKPKKRVAFHSSKPDLYDF